MKLMKDNMTVITSAFLLLLSTFGIAQEEPAATEGEDARAEVQVEDEEPCGWTRDQLHISLEREDSDVEHDSDDRWPRSPSSYSVSERTSDSEFGRRASREEEEQDERDEQQEHQKRE